MKNYLKRAAMCFALILLVVSCAEEDVLVNNEAINTSNLAKKIKTPGFADNNMVLYWNAKTETVLSTPLGQPYRTRYFAMIQIAVHDALNNIKPKYERYALNEKEKFADPDAAVASAAYWAIKLLGRQGAFPIDTWYAESLATIPDGESKELGITLGKKAAQAIYDKRLNDGLLLIPLTSLTPPNGVNPGEYRSTTTAVNYVPTEILSPFRILYNWGTKCNLTLLKTISSLDLEPLMRSIQLNTQLISMK